MDNVREKLVGLLAGCGICFHCLPSGIHEEREIFRIADHLIANGVTVQKEGYWVEENGVQVCSNCGEEHSWEEYRASFCEDCGARMLPTPPKGE